LIKVSNASNNGIEHIGGVTAVSEGNADENFAQEASVVGNVAINGTSNQCTSIVTSRAAKFRIVPPNAKTIFASRFAADTTCKQISDFICENLPEKTQVYVIKIKTNPGREKLSFKITVPDEFFDKVVDPAFWPDHTLVREFTSSTSGPSRMNIGNQNSSRSQAATKQSRRPSYNRRSQRQIRQGSSRQRIASSALPVRGSQSFSSNLQSTDIFLQAPQSTIPTAHQQSTTLFRNQQI